jgi:STE24 endopeptidase
MNTWFLIVLFILVFGLLLEVTTSLLNLKALTPDLPDDFSDIYNKDEYAKSQKYTRATTHLSMVSSIVTTTLVLLFLIFGGFNSVDLYARSFQYGSIVTGLIFSGCLALLTFLVSLPFSLYSTFVIEEQFGFNKTTLKTFIMDTLKAALLMVILGGPLLSLILWFFESAGNFAWFYCWCGVVVFSVIIQFLAPVLIFPLFNKFFPLEEGELKRNILQYSEKEDFKIQGIFTMDGSKRSTKLNAFFTGFGRFRKIVFYDTLLEKLTTQETVAVLAHEMGHFKRKHVVKMLAGSIAQTGIMFYLLSLIMNNRMLFDAFSMTHTSIYASLVFFSFIYSPVNSLVSIVFNFLSRKHEYEADSYAVKTTGHQKNLITALKKLCQANLTNLTPHPLVVFLEYTHPPVLLRIQAIRRLQQGN